jgi:hypothetical protein
MTTDETSTDDTDEANDPFDDPADDVHGGASHGVATVDDDVADESVAGERDDDGGRLPDGDGTAYLKWAAFVLLGLIAAIALFRFYFAASNTISIWISPDFEPMFQAAFNLVVLLAAGAGLAKLARHIG